MERTKWFDRTFNFDFTENIFPSIIGRLSQTPQQLTDLISSLPEVILTVRVDDTWSIKENIGHLADLEPLWQGRFEDIKNGETLLRPTDLQNRKTDLANHNAQPTSQLLENFTATRLHTLKLLEGIDEETIFKSALHPRLKTPMRTMDLFLFVAEHDDHHLARIAALGEQLK